MSMIHLNNWVGLALSAALIGGCVAAPAVIKTYQPSVLGETYGQNSNPPEIVKAVPVGQDVVVPQGKAAMTLFVVIPQKEEATTQARKTQYIIFSSISQVVVTITGENLTNPVTTTINVSSGASAAGTVVLNAGRNQIVTAIGKDSSGKVIATVKGVATSQAGQVVNAVAKFGTTPLASVISGLSPTVAPQINLAAINGVIDPILSPTTNNGQVTYATHPTFINPTPLINAINSLVTGGTSPSAITTANINSQLGGALPIYSASTLYVRLRDPLGNVYSIPTQGWNTTPYFLNSNNATPDGSTFYSNNYPNFNFSLSDPVTYQYNSINQSSSQTSLANVPPGTYQLSFNSYGGISSKPWWVLPVGNSVSVTITQGTVSNADIKFIDVSKSVPITSAGGSFTGSYNAWSTFQAASNLVYTLNYSGLGGANNSNGGLSIFDQSGTQLYQSATATGSYTYASGATTSLYVYTPYYNNSYGASSSTTVNVITQSLGASQSFYNATVQYAQ